MITSSSPTAANALFVMAGCGGSHSSTDEFINQGCVEAVGKKFIVVTNYSNDGNIYIYDRSGKAIRKINRNGQGREEENEFYMVMLTPINAQGESWATLNAFDLCRDYQKGKLKGKLKEVAATLEDDDNRVVMLVKSKK